MCEKNDVDSNFVLGSKIVKGAKVIDLLLGQEAHLVKHKTSCTNRECGKNCIAFIFNDKWYGLDYAQYTLYLAQLKDKPTVEDQFIPG